METKRYQADVPEESAGKRLDQVLPELFPEFSRSRLQAWLKEGQIAVNAQQWKQRDRVQGHESVVLLAKMELDERWQAEAIALNLVYEDEHILVIDKPAGLVVHPGAGNPRGTMLNALLHHAPELAALPRAGIVHRIDKETSGLLVVARSPLAHKHLVEALKEKTVEREYAAAVQGAMTGGGTINQPIGRHPRQRTRMAVVRGGREAVTHYRVIQRYPAHTYIKVNLETGRTHQIRVHMAHIHYPLVGDPVYGGRPRVPAGMSDNLRSYLRAFPRQALHARRLRLRHPALEEEMEWSSPLPADFQDLLGQLQTTLDQPS